MAWKKEALSVCALVFSDLDALGCWAARESVVLFGELGALTMKYVAAYLLTVLGGKESTKENLEALLGSVGIDWEPRGDTLLSAMEGKELEEVLKAGEEMLVKGGGGGAWPLLAMPSPPTLPLPSPVLRVRPS